MLSYIHTLPIAEHFIMHSCITDTSRVSPGHPAVVDLGSLEISDVDDPLGATLEEIAG